MTKAPVEIVPSAGHGITILSYSPIDRRGGLIGFCDVRIDARKLPLHGCAVYRQGDVRWIGMPGHPQLNRDSNVLRDPETKKVRYTPVVSWDDKERLRRFSDAVVRALLAYAPAFDRERPMTDLGTAARAMRGNYDIGRRSASVPGSGHKSRKDRSLEVWVDADGQIAFHTWAGDPLKILKFTKECDLQIGFNWDPWEWRPG